jgi:CHAT domain-containing protein
VLADPVFSQSDGRVPALTAQSSNSQKTADLSLNNRHYLYRAAEDIGETNFIGSLARLPATRWEAQQITSLIPAKERLLALDFAANLETATSAELGQYRIIHFATHSLIDSLRPELSGIVLSLVNKQGEEQDGFLRSHEIYNLRLPAELVVLSGCRTGLGKEVKGEGLIGLTRGFMYAGAKRVAVSLWKVEDKPTAELMARFYKKMLGHEKLSPAAALRAAQLEMWRDERWHLPYYWAAFVLQGEWK